MHASRLGVANNIAGLNLFLYVQLDFILLRVISADYVHVILLGAIGKPTRDGDGGQVSHARNIREGTGSLDLANQVIRAVIQHPDKYTRVNQVIRFKAADQQGSKF